MDPQDGWIGSWSPGIGDPSIVGWATTLAYLCTAWVSWRTLRYIPRLLAEARRERALWAALALLFLALGINKQLDLQTAFTAIGRMLARSEGWYGERRAVQWFFIQSMVLAAVIGLVGVLFLVRRTPWQAKLACVGTTFVTAFVLIRASSFHHVDLVLKAQWLGMTWNWILELGGILLTLAAATSRLKALGAAARAVGRSAQRRVKS